LVIFNLSYSAQQLREQDPFGPASRGSNLSAAPGTQLIVSKLPTHPATNCRKKRPAQTTCRSTPYNYRMRNGK
jgi:hypothetical protein